MRNATLTVVVVSTLASAWVNVRSPAAAAPPREPGVVEPAAPPCGPGQVPRAAGPGDTVCVGALSHDRAAIENRRAGLRRDPDAADPQACLPGLVWREAFARDQVCVAPRVREIVREENAREGDRERQ